MTEHWDIHVATFNVIEETMGWQTGLTPYHFTAALAFADTVKPAEARSDVEDAADKLEQAGKIRGGRPPSSSR